MTEQIQDQISAFIDDELTAEECEFFVRRLERDPETHAKAVRYATIGASMRGELLAPDPAVLRRAIAQAISGVPAPAQPRVEHRGPTARFIKPALGVAVAASMAIAGLVALNSLNELRSTPLPAVASSTGIDTLSEAPSYVVPQDPVGTQNALPPIRLTNYLMRHGEYASGLSRQSIHSIVVGQDEAPEDVNADPWE